MFPSPSIKAPSLENYQFSYNGLTFGANTAIGTLLIEGLDLADIRSGDINIPRDHGQFMGLDLYGGKDIIFDIWMKSGGTSLQKTQLELAAATNVRPSDELPLWFQLPNLPTLCRMVRPRKRIVKIDAEYSAGNIAKPELGFHASDPRIYTEGKETALLHPKPPEGTTVKLNNLGNTEMRPIVILDGPVTRPAIQSLTISSKPYIELADPKVPREELAGKIKREGEELIAKIEAREDEEETFREAEAKAYEEWRHGPPPFEKERDEKIAAAKKVEEEETATREATEKTAREAAEKTEEEAKTEREKDEREGLEPTVKESDQLVINLGTPHLLQYYKGGIGVGEPENVSDWLVPGSVWWDLLAGENELKFFSYDEAEKTGGAIVQWASTYEL